MAIVVTYDIPSNTITVTGGTAGVPATFNDIQVANDGGGWGVIINPCTDVYCLSAHLKIGDGIISTYFSSKLENIEFSLTCIIKTHATVTIGAVSGNWSKDGSRWALGDGGGNVDILSGGTINIYSSVLVHNGSNNRYQRFKNGNVIIKNSIFMGTSIGYMHAFWFNNTLTSISIDDLYVCNFYAFFLYKNGTFNNIQLEGCPSGFQLNTASMTINDLLVTNSATIELRNMGAGAPNLTILDPRFHPTKIAGSDGCWIEESYTCNIHVVDKDGVNVNAATVACEDQFGTPIFSVNTNAGGDIVEQNITYKRWVDSSETLTTYSPHIFTISKAGYETMELDDVTVDAPIVWHLELQNSGSQRPRLRMHGA